MEATRQKSREYTGAPKHTRRYLVLVVFAAIVGVIGIAYYLTHRSDNTTYTGYDIIATKQLSFSSAYGMIPIKGGVLRYARDGVEAVNTEGSTMWNVAYNMSNPVADACGNFAAVGDAGGVSLYLLDGTGKVCNVTTDHPIVKVAISANGETAVLLDGGADAYVVIYHIDGTRAVDLKSVSSTYGFPVDLAISENGAKLVISFVYFDEDNIRSRLAFYNFGDVGKGYIEGIVGKAESVETSFADNLYGDVIFVTNDKIAVIGDKSFLLYDMEEIQGTKPVEIPYTGTVRRFAYSGDYIGFLTEQQENGHIGYSVLLYNLQGKMIEKRDLDAYYGGFRIEGGDVLLYNDISLYIFRVKGKDKYKGSISKSISFICAVDGKNQFALICDNQYNKIKLLTGGKSK